MRDHPVLVVGGAGYIGSHVARLLSESGHNVVVFDDLSTGFKESLINGEKLIEGNILDRLSLQSLFKQYSFQTVLHFAASIVAPQSIEQPLQYYSNNTSGTIQLLKTCMEHDVKNFIFSSTAAVYGNSADGMVSEDSLTLPINPYGWSKLFSERIITDVSRISGMKFVVLRYFNVAGADPKARIGQRSRNATHLLKVCCEAALGLRNRIEIFGTDYPTHDGTGIRDYIHVEDLAQAHLCAVNYLQNMGISLTLNVGYGRGSSVREVIEAVRRISGSDLVVVDSLKRPGDPPSLIARADKIRKILRWEPRYNSLDQIVGDALRWERKLYKVDPSVRGL